MMRVAQLGVGYWGPNLLRNLVANPDCEVVRVVDCDEGRRDFVRSLYPSVAVSDRVEDVLEDSAIDAVVIATPAVTHFDLVMKALRAGKHVLVEKPMARTAAEVRSIRDAASEAGLVAMVGHTFIYNAAVRYVKRLIDDGELGDVRYIYSQRLNLGRIRSDVDALWNLAPHDVSIIQYLLGNPSPAGMTRCGMDFVQDGIDDVVFLTIAYPDGVLANIHVSWLDPRKVRQMTVVGSRKMVVYDDIADNKIAIYDKGIEPKAVIERSMPFDRTGFPQYSLRSGDVLLPKINFQEPLKVEIAHFVRCVAEGESCLTGPDHALEVVRILEGSA